jgi:hypothetical protein
MVQQMASQGGQEMILSGAKFFKRNGPLDKNCKISGRRINKHGQVAVASNTDVASF